MARIASTILLAALILAGPRPVPAQRLAPVHIPLPPAAAAPDTTLGDALRSLASQAGVAFVGQVTGIQHTGGVVEVRFRVDQTLLGSPGPTYTLREWAGLWAAGQQRYALGQSALLFLHAPGAAGLSSPVDGMEGVVPLLPIAANAPPLLDIRRLATRIERAPGAPLAAADTGAVALPDAVAVVASRNTRRLEPALLPLPEGVRPRPAPPRTIFLSPPFMRAPLVLGVADAGR